VTNVTTTSPVSAVPNRVLITWAVVIGLLAYALLPALTRSHVEGFTYFTETLSMLLPEVSDIDPLWAQTQDYFYLSRPGVVWAMVPLSNLAPGNGYDLLMWLAMPVFLSGVVVVARLLSGAPWLACVAALLALPIALEANFFYNDNVLATGLSLWAIALLLGGPSTLRAASAGLLFSAAVLCRLDQVLLGPLFLVLLLVHGGPIRRVVLRAAAMAAGFVAVHGAMAFLDPNAANLLHRIGTITVSDALWERGDDPFNVRLTRDLAAITLAFGAGLPIILAGAATVYARARAAAAPGQSIGKTLSHWAIPVILLGYPVFIYAFTFGRFYDPRGAMIFVPMVAPMAAIGLQRWIIDPILNQSQTAEAGPKGRFWVAALLVAPMAVPGLPLMQNLPALSPETENAPDTITGRIWQGQAWRDWQTTEFHQREDALRVAISEAISVGGQTTVMTMGWNDEQRLNNVLASQGFFQDTVMTPECDAVSQGWSHPNGTHVLHIRTHVPFLPSVGLFTSAMYLARAVPCLETAPEERRFLLRTNLRVADVNDYDANLERSQLGPVILTNETIEVLARAAASVLVANDLDDADPLDNARRLLAEADAILN